MCIVRLCIWRIMYLCIRCLWIRCCSMECLSTVTSIFSCRQKINQQLSLSNPENGSYKFTVLPILFRGISWCHSLLCHFVLGSEWWNQFSSPFTMFCRKSSSLRCVLQEPEATFLCTLLCCLCVWVWVGGWWWFFYIYIQGVSRL